MGKGTHWFRLQSLMLKIWSGWLVMVTQTTQEVSSPEGDMSCSKPLTPPIF